MAEAPQRIDVHHHMVPGPYAQWLSDHGVRPGGVKIPEWTSQKSLKLMNRMGIRATILSVSAPGVWLGDSEQARYWARWLNENAARIAGNNPHRFGYLTTVPLPDIDAAIAEAQYGFEHLHADGVLLPTNVDATYLGDPAYTPLLEYLNSRKAVVLVHPADPPFAPLEQVPPYVADAMLETTRAALNLIYHETLSAHPDIRFVLGSAGGFLPFIAYRVLLASLQRESATAQMLAFLRRRELPQRLDILKAFYYDLAVSSSSSALASLLDVADERKVLFGTDFPDAPTDAVRFMVDQYDRYDLTLYQRQNIDYRNAYSLFPRLTMG